MRLTLGVSYKISIIEFSVLSRVSDMKNQQRISKRREADLGRHRVNVEQLLETFMETVSKSNINYFFAYYYLLLYTHTD